MKLFWTCFALFLWSNTLLTQKSVGELWNPPIGQDRFSISYSQNYWLNLPNDVELQLFSPGFSASIMHDYQFGKSVLSFAWGYGIDSHNVRYNGFFSIDTVQGSTQTILHPFSRNYQFKKNKLVATYLEIPLELRLRTFGDHKFKIYLGGKVGYLVGIHNKIKDNQGKRKYYGLDNVMNYRYGLTAKIGVNNVVLSGFYSLTPLIKKGKGSQVVPVSIGITFFLI